MHGFRFRNKFVFFVEFVDYIHDVWLKKLGDDHDGRRRDMISAAAFILSCGNERVKDGVMCAAGWMRHSVVHNKSPA